MTTLKDAQKQGKVAKFAMEHRRDPKGDEDAFNRTVAAMAGKSKAVPKASPPDDCDD